MAKTLQQLADLATEHMQAGRVKEGIAAHKKLLVREPDLPDSWYNLGYLQRRARLFAAALESYQQALNRGVRGAEEVHLNRAVILTENLARHDEAIDELRKALIAKPQYVPAMLNLGELLEDSGEVEEARKLYERVLELDPMNPLALARIVSGMSVVEKNDPNIARLREAIELPSATSADKADLGFALGQALDSAGMYSDAFSAYQAANAASRLSIEPPLGSYDALEREEYIDKLISTFDVADAVDSGEQGGAPIFVCGMIRTGSTLAERILSAHSQVTAAGEVDMLPSLIAEKLQPYPKSVAGRRAYDFKKYRKTYLKGMRALHPDTEFITDKRPDNFLHIGLIKRLFPDAKFIHTKRNPVDSALSIWFAHLDPNMVFALDFKSIAHWLAQFRRLETHWKSLWPDDIYDFDYDGMVADSESHIRRLLEFCDLQWEESCLEPHRAKGIVRTSNALQIREPLYQKSSGRWTNYEAHIGDLLEALEAEGLKLSEV